MGLYSDITVTQKEPQSSSAGQTPLPQQPVQGPEAEEQSIRHRDDKVFRRL